jgi:hypothetical protein
MIKPRGECAIGTCSSIGEPRALRYWPGGMREIRGTRPRLAICDPHWPSVEAKMADPRHWRAVYRLGVLSFRPTGVSPDS